MFLTALRSIDLSSLPTTAILNTILLIALFLFLEFADSEETDHPKPQKQLVFPFILLFTLLVGFEIVKTVFHVPGL